MKKPASQLSQGKSKRPLPQGSYYRMQESFREWLGLLGYSQSSIRWMPVKLGEFFSWLEREGIRDTAQVTAEQVRDFYHYMKYHRKNHTSGGFLHSGTLNSYIVILKLFARYLEETGQGKLTIDLPYEPLITTSHREVLTLREIDKLYGATTDGAQGMKERAILSLYYGCGLRSNEGIQMNVEDVMGDKKLVYVRKGKMNKERYVPFVEGQQKDFTEYLEYGRPALVREKDETAFLVGNSGRRIIYNSLLKIIKRIQQRSGDEVLMGKQIGLHTLRHSIATHLMQGGMKIEQISRFLGHANLESTQIYTHLIHEYEQ